MPSKTYRLPRVVAGWAATAMAVAVSGFAPPRVQAEPVTLAEALSRASTSSPTLVQGEAAVLAAQGRAEQAGFRPNPELDLSVENFAGTGGFRGLDDSETTLQIGQRLELGGKRTARRHPNHLEA